MTEIHEYIQKYLKEVYPTHYADITLKEIELRPLSKRMMIMWRALAHYGEKNYYKRFEDAPADAPEKTWIHIIDDKKIEDYEMISGGWRKAQELTEEELKRIYE